MELHCRPPSPAGPRAQGLGAVGVPGSRSAPSMARACALVETRRRCNLGGRLWGLVSTAAASSSQTDGPSLCAPPQAAESQRLRQRPLRGTWASMTAPQGERWSWPGSIFPEASWVSAGLWALVSPCVPVRLCRVLLGARRGLARKPLAQAPAVCWQEPSSRLGLPLRAGGQPCPGLTCGPSQEPLLPALTPGPQGGAQPHPWSPVDFHAVLGRFTGAMHPDSG